MILEGSSAPATDSAFNCILRRAAFARLLAGPAAPLAALASRSTTMAEASLKPPVAVDPAGEFIRGTTIASDTASRSVKLPGPMNQFRSPKYSAKASNPVALTASAGVVALGLCLGTPPAVWGALGAGVQQFG